MDNIAEEPVLNQTGQIDAPTVLQFKIIYWGPGESGKTTNFIRLGEKFQSKRISKGFSIATTDNRTLWQDSLYFQFDFEFKIPYKVIIQVATCTGQERFLSTREYVVQGADGAIFVGDSDPMRMDSNVRSYNELIAFAKHHKIPILIQLNKRDLPTRVSVDEFKSVLRLPKAETDQFGHKLVYETIAMKGIGVIEIFNDMVEKILYNYFSKIAG